jgi:hypothetical protein
VSNLGDKLDQWIAPFDWEAVTAMNAALCAKTGSLHRPTSDGHEPCREKWIASHRDEMTFREALEFLKASHRLAPFCFNNGNTFAAIARTLVLQMDLSASAALVRSAAGVLRDDELDAILSQVPAD